MAIISHIILRLPLISILLVFLPTNAKSQRSEIVPYKKWNCGAGEFDKSLSHQMSKEDCPKRMYEADLCCIVHDICYTDDKRTQLECDQSFCHCLDRTVAQKTAKPTNGSSTSGCERVSNSFCEIVKLFGGMAFATAKKLADKQKAALKAWEKKEVAEKATKTTMTKSIGTTSTQTTMESTSQPKTTPQIIPSTSTPSIPPSTVSPVEIGHFVTQKFPLNCLDETLSECTKQLQQCTAQHFNAASKGEEKDALVLGAQMAECSAQFCECASKEQVKNEDELEQNSARWTLAKFGKQPKEECAQHLAAICTQFGDMPMQTGNNVNFWSVNINYIGQPISLGLAIIGSLLLLLILGIFGLFIIKIVGFIKRRLQMDESIRKNYVKSSIRRNTLTALRNVSGGGNENDIERGGPHYMSFGHQKESTVSSPSESEPTAQKLLANGHHHKKTHSAGVVAHHDKNLLHSPHPQQQHMPFNSSQVHLIAGTGNSSSTLSDISSS